MNEPRRKLSRRINVMVVPGNSWEGILLYHVTSMPGGNRSLDLS